MSSPITEDQASKEDQASRLLTLSGQIRNSVEDLLARTDAWLESSRLVLQGLRDAINQAEEARLRLGRCIDVARRFVSAAKRWASQAIQVAEPGSQWLARAKRLPLRLQNLITAREAVASQLGTWIDLVDETSKKVKSCRPGQVWSNCLGEIGGDGGVASTVSLIDIPPEIREKLSKLLRALFKDANDRTDKINLEVAGVARSLCDLRQDVFALQDQADSAFSNAEAVLDPLNNVTQLAEALIWTAEVQAVAVGNLCASATELLSVVERWDEYTLEPERTLRAAEASVTPQVKVVSANNKWLRNNQSVIPAKLEDEAKNLRRLAQEPVGEQ